MVRNREIKFRVTKNQHERILNNAQAKGYVTISSYLRHLALETDLVIENKILENNRILNELKEKFLGEKKRIRL